MRAVAILLTVLLTSLLPVINAGSEKITIESITVSEGMEARVKIILDSAPKGLAGYDVTVTLRDAAIASVIKVELPPWAKLSDSSIRGNSIKLKAVDLDDRIRSGSTNIELATIIFGNTKQGESMIELTVNKMDDDEGNPIIPSIEAGKLTVTGPSTKTAVITLTHTVTQTYTLTQSIYIYTTITENTTNHTRITLFTITALVAIAVVVAAAFITASRMTRD
jgi:hypothetical protein